MQHEWDERLARLEAILFASGEPISVERLCTTTASEREEILELLHRLPDEYAFNRRGIRLIQMEERWQLCSAPEFGDDVHRAFEIRKTAKLSQPALEVLSIIAYYQPTTRSYIDQIRGVDSSYTVGLLQNRGLIRDCGFLQVSRRPCIYETTEDFLRAFHLKTLEDLPPLAEEGEAGQMMLTTQGALFDPLSNPGEAPGGQESGKASE